MQNEQIKHMVDRFLTWRLPKTFGPDGGISYTPLAYPASPETPMPVGTNLFTATEADAMIRYMIEGLPVEVAPSATEYAWLIEAPGPRYLYVRNMPATDHEFLWTADHNVALRFKDKRQADLTMMAIRQQSPDLFAFERLLGDAKPVEHGWG